jgi:hypothetical protein
MFSGRLEAETLHLQPEKPSEEWVDRGILESSPGGRLAWWSRGSTDRRPKHFLERDGDGQGSHVLQAAPRRAYTSPARGKPGLSCWLLRAVGAHVTEGTRRQMVLPLPHRSTGLRAAKVQSRLEADLDRQLSVYREARGTTGAFCQSFLVDKHYLAILDLYRAVALEFAHHL